MQNTSIFYSRLQRGPWQTWRAPLATAGPAWLRPTPPHIAQVAPPALCSRRRATSSTGSPAAHRPQHRLTCHLQPAHRPQHRVTLSPPPPAQGHLQPTAVRSCPVQDHSCFSAAPWAAPKLLRDTPDPAGSLFLGEHGKNVRQFISDTTFY